MNEPIRLSEALTRRVAIEWFEAVAVVRAVVDALTPQTGIPELDQIALAPDGRVSISGRTTMEEPVQRLGQLLQGLLLNTDVPVQLRLVISSATAPTSTFATPAECSGALAMFERPGRASVLSRLYVKIASASAAPGQVAAPTLDPIAHLPEQPSSQQQQEQEDVKRRARRRLVMRITAAVALALMLLTASLARGRSLPWRSRTQQILARASDVVDRAVMTGASAVTDRMGFGRIVSASSEPPEPAAPPKVSKPTAARSVAARASVRRAVESRPMFQAFDVEATVAVPDFTRSFESLVSSVPARLDPPAAVDVPKQDFGIYDVSAPGVTPAVAVRPQLPQTFPPGLNRDRLSRIELVVSFDGSVESVKLIPPLGRSSSINDVMLLAAAKAWQFDPAKKDGLPVRFRKIVWIAYD